MVALVRQWLPALAILLPGTACGKPYAPEYGFSAYLFQPLSRFDSLHSGVHCRLPQRKSRIIPWAVRSMAGRCVIDAKVRVAVGRKVAGAAAAAAG